LRPLRIRWTGSANKLGLSRSTERVSSITTAVEPISRGFAIAEDIVLDIGLLTRFCASAVIVRTTIESKNSENVDLLMTN